MKPKQERPQPTSLGGPGPRRVEGEEEAGPSQPEPSLEAMSQQQSKVFQEVARRLNERMAAQGMDPSDPVTENTVRHALDQLARGGPEALAASIDISGKGDMHQHDHHDGQCDHEHGLVLPELEEAQGCWELYQRAYLVHLDVAFPPMFVAAVAGLFLLRILPFLFAFFLVPLAYVVGTSLCLVKVGGIPTKAIPFTSFPATTVVSLEVAAITTFAIGLFPMFYVTLLPCIAFFILSLSALYLQYRTWRRDPGFLPLGPRGGAVLDPAQRAALQSQNPAWCYTCDIYRPIRSKHCPICNRCCEEFDHHCPVVGTCVAGGNRREFLGYLATLFTAEAIMLFMGVRYCRLLTLRVLHVHTLPGLGTILRNFSTIMRLSPGVLYMLLITAGVTVGTAALLGRALWGTSAGLTTNEMIGRRRYPYLQAPNGRYSNPFDAGPFQNCYNFWKTERPDWYRLYTEHIAAEGEEGGITFRPVATRILRRWDKARWALERARFERRARREEELLRRGRWGAVASQPQDDPEIQAA